MKIYVFGNKDLNFDNAPFKVVKKLKGKIQNLEFIIVNPNEDLPFEDGQDVVMVDTVLGINKVEIISDNDLDKLILGKSTTVHDFDLGFQLKYLKKLGKIGKVIIIGLPMNSKLDYSLIQSTLRKLVAQDIQGS
ncbi:MAG: hypothetical protein M1409_10100 [Actinobacteria bacterium]|nr:hypothetical protein [Actinomycetota bacterium]